MLALNRLRCPPTDLAARHTEDPRDNSDIHPPLWLARHNRTAWGIRFRRAGLSGTVDPRARTAHLGGKEVGVLHNPVFLAALEVFVVGLPFCVFKALTGTLAGGWGLLLIALAAVDLVFNLRNLATLAWHRGRIRPVCLLAWLFSLRAGAKAEARRELGAALDVALSFLLVAVVVGGGLLGRLPAGGLQAWNLAVVLNVLGAGAFQVNQAVARLRA